MSKRATLPQLKKHDVTQKIIETLADAEARAILFSTVKRGMTAADLSYKLNIPPSSVYKKLGDLAYLALIDVEGSRTSESGRKYKVYRSRISQATVTVRAPEAQLEIVERSG